MSSKNIVDLRSKRPVADRRTLFKAPVHVADASARTSPLRAQRRRLRLFIFLTIVSLLAVIALELSYISYMPRYAINAISVRGVRSVPARLVTRYVDTQLHPSGRSFFSTASVFTFDPEPLEADIVGFFPRVKSANISRASLLASAIMVTIEERREFALWCAAPDITASSTGCYSLDDDGFIFAPADESLGVATTTRTYVFSGGLSTTTNPIGSSFAPGHLPGMLALFGELQRMRLTPIGATVDENGTDFSVALSEGFDIKASFGQDAGTLMRNLDLILKSDALQGKQADIQYIDLRFADRAYYKLKSGPEPDVPAR